MPKSKTEKINGAGNELEDKSKDGKEKFSEKSDKIGELIKKNINKDSKAMGKIASKGHLIGSKRCDPFRNSNGNKIYNDKINKIVKLGAKFDKENKNNFELNANLEEPNGGLSLLSHQKKKVDHYCNRFELLNYL